MSGNGNTPMGQQSSPRTVVAREHLNSAAPKMGDYGSVEDDLDEQPIALRTFVAPARKCTRHARTMSTRRGELYLSPLAAAHDDGLTFDAPNSCETITPTPRAAKFSSFSKNAAVTPQFRRASIDGEEDGMSNAMSATTSAVTTSASPVSGVSNAGASLKSSNEAVDELVEIKVRPRKPVEAEHRRGQNGLDSSAFDDVPPAEVYDSSWNTLPFRCEAGQLRHGRNTSSKEPILPGEFRLTANDLDDDEEEDEDDAAEQAAAKAKREKEAADASARAKKAAEKKAGEEITAKQRAALGRLFIKRRNAARNTESTSSPPSRVELKLKKVNRNAIESTRASKAAMHHLSVILQCDYQAEVVAHKGHELRIRVPIAVGGEKSPHLVVISSVDLWTKGSKMTFRRSLTDISRISNEEFFTFCEDVNRRFTKLEQSSTSGK